MKELILMTAASRKENLKQTYDSIENCFRNVSDVHVTWLICHDQYNMHGNLDKIIDLCKKGCAEFGMGWLVYDTGKKGQPNYGGDMYNDALKWIKENWFKEADPWVYILDDDNIIHPAMALNFNHITDVCDKKGKKMIWLTMSHDYAGLQVSHELWEYSYHTKKNGERATFQLPDPSQILMRHSEIEKMGMYDSCFEYDRKIWEYFEMHYDEILFADEWLECPEYYLTSQIQSFHNGQILDKTIKEIEAQKNRTYYMVCQGNSLSDYAAIRIPIPKYIGDTCYLKTKNDAIQKGYINDNRIFKNIDKIYILTQTDTPHRWNFVINQFKKLGVYDEVADKIELVKGVKIPFISQNVLELMIENGAAVDAYHNVTKTQNIGLLNCGVEHYRIMKKAIAEGYENVMIIEDDACFIKDIQMLKTCLETIPSDFTLLHLEGYFCPSNEEERKGKIEFLSTEKQGAEWVPYEHLRLWNTGCIIYSKKGMELYTSKQETFFAGVDWRSGDIIEGAYFYNYPIVRQENTAVIKSGISNKNLDPQTNLFLTYSNNEDYFDFLTYGNT